MLIRTTAFWFALSAAFAGSAVSAAGIRTVVFREGRAHVPGRDVVEARQAEGAEAAAAASAVRALGGSQAEAEAVGRVYQLRAGALAWMSFDGMPGAAASVMQARFTSAATHGLDPGTYLLPEVVAAFAGGRSLDRHAMLTRDVAVTLASLRYMRHLHLGRVDPRRLGLRLQVWAEPHDFARILSDALTDGGLGSAIDRLAPPYSVYSALVVQLARYRDMANRPLPTLPTPSQTVKAGDQWSGVAALASRLVAFGDLEADEAPQSGTTPPYAGPLIEGVRRFQTRHGLTPDGAIGARTVAALQVPIATRRLQLELALERLRWLPDLGTRRVVMVNIPMFRLWAWEAGQLDQPPARSMEVIVGRAMRHETPVFVESMTHVIFQPYWNVPPSIVVNEVLPAVRRNPRYLATQQMEIVRGPGDDAKVVTTNDAVAALAAGTARLRQRPGPHNALGLVKFVFPNSDSVFMHDTPSPLLFGHDRRDFSHGCIRVANPQGLASWALSGVPGWSDARVASAMATDTNLRADVAEPIDVILFYMTAMVRPEDGALHFADDIYGHDAPLAWALGHRNR